MKFIPLRDTKGNCVARAKVDDLDYAWLSQWRWCLNSNGRAIRVSGTTVILMHRAICGLVKGDGKEVDHWNGAPLDNRRANLKVVTRALNSQNLAKRKDAKHSRFRGVGRNLRTGKWTASVRVNGQRFHAGTFETEEDAAAAASELRRSVFSNSNEARNVKTRKRSRVAY